VVDRFAPLLARIDDRLVHGQVVVGCCEPLGARHIVLVDDGVAGDTLQQKLYRLAAPPSIGVHFAAVDAAAGVIESMETDGELARTVIVAARAKTMDRLREAGIEFQAIQLGGAHAREATDEIVPGFFLDSGDRAALRSLIEAGAEVFVQPVAASASHPLELSMLEEGGAP
jgi:mannose/fructose/N-acetylgalactosamine-specific phosphotransferase system component IIB